MFRLFAFAEPSTHRFGDCSSPHQAPIRIKAHPEWGGAPSADCGPENPRFQAVSKCFGTDLMDVTNPCVAHGLGGKEPGNRILWSKRLANQIRWFSHPLC
jgi:hypothetical protein